MYYGRCKYNCKTFIPVVVDGMLITEERITWRRIKAEPESLLEEESEEVLKEYAEGRDMFRSIKSSGYNGESLFHKKWSL